MRLPSILSASVVVFSLFVVTAGGQIARGSDPGPVNDYDVKSGDKGEEKKCTDAGGTLYRDDRNKEKCHPKPPKPPPCVSKNKPGDKCDNDNDNDNDKGDGKGDKGGKDR